MAWLTFTAKYLPHLLLRSPLIPASVAANHSRVLTPLLFFQEVDETLRDVLEEEPVSSGDEEHVRCDICGVDGI